VTTYSVPTSSPTRPFRARFAARWWQNCILRQLGLVVALLISAGFAEAFAAEGQSVAVPFTALSTYYISPTGNDQSAGTSPKTAWATPHHNVNCGDVILVEPGNYILGKYITAFGANNWGTVANCPSRERRHRWNRRDLLRHCPMRWAPSWRLYGERSAKHK
jgi:hypothetical protein